MLLLKVIQKLLIIFFFFSTALNSRGILVQQFCVTITREQYCATNNFTCRSGRSELQCNLQHLLTLVPIRRRSPLAHTISYPLSRVQSLLRKFTRLQMWHFESSRPNKLFYGTGATFPQPSIKRASEILQLYILKSNNLFI